MDVEPSLAFGIKRITFSKYFPRVTSIEFPDDQFLTADEWADIIETIYNSVAFESEDETTD